MSEEKEEEPTALEMWVASEGLEKVVDELVKITRKKVIGTRDLGDWREHHRHADNLLALLSIQQRVK